MTKRFTKFFSVDSPKAIMASDFGYLNAINYMAPHSTAGRGDLCGNSTKGCRDLCLGWYSGHAAMVTDLNKGTNKVRESRIAKAQWFMDDRKAFMAEMTSHVEALIRKANRESLDLCVRPNGSTDLAFEYIKTDNGQSLPVRYPETQFIDYTKSLERILNKNRPANYHLTFSLSEENRLDAEQALIAGYNVAVVFGEGLPKQFMGHDVIDGTTHDLRHLDPSPVIVGLEPKGKLAKNDTSGFVVRGYDHG